MSSKTERSYFFGQPLNLPTPGKTETGRIGREDETEVISTEESNDDTLQLRRTREKVTGVSPFAETIPPGISSSSTANEPTIDLDATLPLEITKNPLDRIAEILFEQYPGGSPEQKKITKPFAESGTITEEAKELIREGIKRGDSDISTGSGMESHFPDIVRRYYQKLLDSVD